MRKCLLSLLGSWPVFLVLIVTSAWAQKKDKGVIEGTVANEMGMPVPKAKVHADLIVGRPQSTLYRFEETDENGHFSIDGLEWGEYVVGAMKKEDGYPYQLNKLYVTGPLPHVGLTPEEPVAKVQIQFAWKAALLAGRATDAMTGSPLQTMFKLSHKPDSQTENYLTTQFADYKVLLPPNTPIYLEVSADGYKPWYFPGGSDSSGRSPLRLSSGETLNLDIALEPYMSTTPSKRPPNEMR